MFTRGHLSQFNDAKKYYERALMIWRKIFTKDHADVGNCLWTSWLCNEAKENHETALFFSTKRIFGEQDANAAEGDNNFNLANVYGHL